MNKIWVMGSINMDMVFETETYPQQGETIVSKNYINNGGGKGANQATAIAKQGLTPILLAAVGDDIYGKCICDKLTTYGVDTSNVRIIEGAPTGIAVVTISGGDNRIVLDLGANLQLGVQDYKQTLLDKAIANDVFLTQMETSKDNIIDGIKLAKQLNMTIVVNPAPAKANALDEVIGLIDYIIPNETELQTLTGMPTDTIEHILEAAQCLKSKGVGCVIVTLGKDGSLICDDTHQQIVEARKVIAVDSTAAGDTYVGNICVGIINKQDIIANCKRATVAASITVTKKGAQQSIPTKQEVDKILY